MKIESWILASASPRRRELLAELLESFEVIPAKGEESVEGDYPPEQLVQILAREKALEIQRLIPDNNKGIIGADTVVALDGRVLGKPKNEKEAAEMLQALSGRIHEVYTGVCMLYPTDSGCGVLMDVACTKVYFLPLTKEQIDAYVATGSPMDKAGAYGIQDGGLVKGIKGSYTNVVGFPLELVEKMIRKAEKNWDD